MAKVLSISSQVVYGHVGNSVTAFVLQCLGHDILGVPTIILSNRPGYSAIDGMRIGSPSLDAMLQACSVNGWLDDLDAIVTGYLPSREHVELSARWIAKTKTLQPKLIYFCDPILGDEPGGIYIDEVAATAVRDLLLPLADIVTPNCFELGWLTNREIVTPADAVAAAQTLGPSSVVVTSAPAEAPNSLANILVEDERIFSTSVRRRIVQAHGTGDFFASIFLARILNGSSHKDALLAATSAMDAVLEASDGLSELALVKSRNLWADPSLGHQTSDITSAS